MPILYSVTRTLRSAITSHPLSSHLREVLPSAKISSLTTGPHSWLSQSSTIDGHQFSCQPPLLCGYYPTAADGIRITPCAGGELNSFVAAQLTLSAVITISWMTPRVPWNVKEATSSDLFTSAQDISKAIVTSLSKANRRFERRKRESFRDLKITDITGFLLNDITSIKPFGATNGASEIVGLPRAKLRRDASN